VEFHNQVSGKNFLILILVVVVSVVNVVADVFGTAIFIAGGPGSPAILPLPPGNEIDRKYTMS